MKLVLAEKPSVAQSLAKVLGANKRCDGYLEGNGYVVSWCVGHLVELSQPEAYNETYAKWRLEDLPILPTAWKYQVSASTKKQFGILKDLMKREDVKSLVCATDAGREGELIFRLVIFREIQQEYGGFAEYLWHWTDGKVIYERGLSHSELSDLISKDLKKRGMKFVGTTVIYAYLQAVGVIYSHDEGCFLEHKV